MKQSINLIKKETDLIDKFLISFILLIPLSLAISIFIADLLASISALMMIGIILRGKNLDIFKQIKKEITFFSFFYLIILISLILSNYKSQSFLASFFYFRYFLLSLSIFYLLKKYEFFSKIFFYVIISSIGIVIIDAFIQQIFDYNLFGYQRIGVIGDSIEHLTGFFNQEKKLGSYLVRFTPLILSLIYFHKIKFNNKFEIFFLILVGIITFYSSERLAFFLLLIIYFSYLLLTDKKLIFFGFTMIIFILLFQIDSDLKRKYVQQTLDQTGLSVLFKKDTDLKLEDNLRYYSKEHENLSYTGLVIFKNNYFFGSGVKTHYQECMKLKKGKWEFRSNKRDNYLVCSTHAHNTYVQLLSEIGIFGFLLIIYLFFKVAYKNLKILFYKKKSNFDKAYFYINLSIIINLMPLIPSGSFFNNWMSLIMFFPLGFWLYIRNK